MAKRAHHTNGGDGPCPIMRTCGGCEWLGLPYRKQLKRKHAAMEELFAPCIERFSWDVSVEPVLGMGSSRESGPVTTADAPLASPRGFRHKAASPFAPGAHGAIRGGFFARGTHDIVACPACAVEAPGARELLNDVAACAQSLGIPAYDEDRRCGQLRYAIVRKGWRTGETMLTLVTRSREVPHLDELADALRRAHPELVCVAHNINPRVTNAILGGETRILAGSPRMRDELLGCTFEISPVSFYQVNPQQTEVLYQRAIEGMRLSDGDTLLDTYCGSGTIGLCAAAAARSADIDVVLVGVERNKEGVRDAVRNAQINELDGASTFIARDATEYMRQAAAQGEHVDVLVMDPPRAGSTPEFIEAAAALAPRRIVYISCNPVTQVRDLELLGEAGFALERLTPVDMFPHTTHVETVAVLTRS
ncbi:MAG: 23S rRNA (uracil(1939)-C(5))-methyltransferase RlmD [Coriobacteriaceae bacterium]|nr:23S rRNA (uracil(1939)-C(5))-methyltransferase RlmD [Coriobacteriaceae bacterium]